MNSILNMNILATSSSTNAALLCLLVYGIIMCILGIIVVRAVRSLEKQSSVGNASANNQIKLHTISFNQMGVILQGEDLWDRLTGCEAEPEVYVLSEDAFVRILGRTEISATKFQDMLSAFRDFAAQVPSSFAQVPNHKIRSR